MGEWLISIVLHILHAEASGREDHKTLVGKVIPRNCIQLLKIIGEGMYVCCSGCIHQCSNTQHATIAILPLTIHPSSWAEHPDKHTGVYIL